MQQLLYLPPTPHFWTLPTNHKAITTNFYGFTGFKSYTTFIYPPQNQLSPVVKHLLARASEAKWALVIRTKWLMPECYPTLLKNKNIIFISMTKLNPILIPSKKQHNGSFFTQGDPNKKTFIAAHNPSFASLRKRFFIIKT